MKIIVITGASSGFGALTARALAKAGHTVYAGMRDTTGRNAPQVEEAKKFAKDNKVICARLRSTLHRKLQSTLRFRRLSARTKD